MPVSQLRHSCSGHPALLRMALLESALGGRDLSGPEPTLATVGLIERLIEAHFDCGRPCGAGDGQSP